MNEPSSASPPIDRRSHPLVRRLRRLLRSPEERRREHAYLVAGVRVVEEALGSQSSIACSLLSPRLERDLRGRDLAARLRLESSRTETVSDDLMSWLLGAGSHQGVVVQLRREEEPLDRLLDPQRRPFLLLAWGVQDPGNLGGLIRVGGATGVSGFIALEGSADPFSLKSARAASGALFRLPVHGLTGLAGLDLLDRLRQTGYRLSGTVARGGTPYDSAAWKQPTALLVGGEGAGLPEPVLAALDERLTIPMAGGTESLNVLSAATLVLYAAAHARELF